MSDFNRTTRECAYNQLRPELLAAIQKHATEHELGDIESDAMICCETTSDRKKGGGDKVIYTAMLVTPRWLVWATSGDKQKPVAMSARLGEIEARDYETTPLYKLVQDSGINVLGISTGVAERGEIFIGLGKEPSAQHFRGVLKQAMRALGR
jgi:hypothetical protein